MRNGLNFKTFVIFSTPNRLGVWRNVYALVLGTSLARGGGSSPLTPTTTFVATNVALKKKCCTRNAIILGLITLVVSIFLKSTEFTKLKFVAVIVALKTKCCKVERVCIEGFSSRPLVRLRNQ